LFSARPPRGPRSHLPATGCRLPAPGSATSAAGGITGGDANKERCYARPICPHPTPGPGACKEKVLARSLDDAAIGCRRRAALVAPGPLRLSRAPRRGARGFKTLLPATESVSRGGEGESAGWRL